METYWYCTVDLSGVERGYSYISDMGALASGTLVQVPFGSRNTLRIGKVRDCGAYPGDKTPYPPGKTKHILRLATAEEYAADQTAHRGKVSDPGELRVLSCPRCGAPLPDPGEKTTWTCAYCDCVITVGDGGAPFQSRKRRNDPPPEAPRQVPAGSAGTAPPVQTATPPKPAPPRNAALAARFEDKARKVPEKWPEEPAARRRPVLHPLLLAAILLAGAGLLFLPRCGGRSAAAPSSAAAPKAVYRPTPSPSPSPSPIPEIPYFRMMEDSVEKTLLGPAVKVTEPLYPWMGYWDEEDKQTEYWFGTEDFPCFFAVCMFHIVVEVRDYRSEPRPDIPYEGMPEEWVQYTGLGKFEEIARESSTVDGDVFVRRCYALCSGDLACFTVIAENGYVSEVRDLRDSPIPRDDWIASLPTPVPADPEPPVEAEKPSDAADAKKPAVPSPVPADRDYYDNPEDLWLDNMDEFEDFDEAAEYWEEEYG